MKHSLGPDIIVRIRRRLWKLPSRIVAILLSLRYRNDFVYTTKIQVVDGLFRLEQSYSEYKEVIHVFHPQRISRYFIGIQERLMKLFHEYCLHHIDDFRQGGYVVDIGSNVGELSLILARKFPEKLRFIRFEPSDNECRAAERNLEGISQTEIRNPLWFESTTMQFFECNETGDSSLIRPTSDAESVYLTTTTLDQELSHLMSEGIVLLKLEAEGAEPEVLRGGRGILPFISWVAADLGPERGIDKEETFAVCDKILKEAGFSLWATNPGGRKCYLYKNVKLQRE